MKKKKIFLACLLLSAGCAKKTPRGSTENTLANHIADSVNCKDARAAIFDTYFKAYQENENLSKNPNIESFAQKLKSKFEDQILSHEKAAQLESALKKIHKIMTTEVNQIQERAGHLKRSAFQAEGEVPEDESRNSILHLIRLEMRSHIESDYDQLNQQLDEAILEAQLSATASELPCRVENDKNIPPKDSTAGALWGAHFAMATAYQSCQVLKLDPVNASTESAEGVEKYNKVDSVGWGRRYTDLDLLKRTHYYHHGQVYNEPCLNQDQKPLVYDYGGAPVIKSQNELDLFTNYGGGPALGIDCSAFVSTAVGVAGHLYREATANKPVYTRFVSRDFIDPVLSGWSCYESMQVGPNAAIQPGDIAAVQGHVVMIDTVEADPFGLSKITSVNDCNSINYRNFDFTIIQSSPSKGSLGINRYVARDYLSGSDKIRAMFLGYAKQACKSQFDGVSRKPNTSTYGIIRHKKAQACSSSRIALVGEACAASCTGL